jgi:hypothetical protein
MRVLILAHDFPPLNTIGGRRPYSWLRYFPQNGIHPVVVTKSWEHTSSTAVDIVSQKGSAETLIEESTESTVIRIPLVKSYSEKLLAKYGNDRYIFRRKAASFLKLVLSYPFSWFDKNYSIYRAADAYLKEHRVDWIIATGEPFILFKYAHLLSRRHGVPWIADYRDGWYLNHNYAQLSGIVFMLQWQWEFLFEKKYLRSSAFITSVDPILTGKLRDLHDKPAYTFYNGFEELSPPSYDSTLKTLPLTLCYSGTLYPGHQAELLLQALKELHDSGSVSPAELQIKFVGLEFYPDQLKRVTEYSPDLKPYFTTTKRLPREDARQIMNSADFLIVFADRWTPVLPSKMYECIAARRPVLIIPGDHSILSEMTTDLRAGIVVDSVDELKSVLLEKIRDKKSHRKLFDKELDIGKVMIYSRQHQATVFAGLLKKRQGESASGNRKKQNQHPE